MIFPPEIWARIFGFMDVVTLTGLKSVCKSWRALIDETLKKNDGWYKKCKTDIPEELWSSLCEKLSPDRTVKTYAAHNGSFWMPMLKLWSKCKNIRLNEARYEQYEPIHASHGAITCVTSSKDLLAIGTTTGYVYFYNVNDILEEPLHILDQLAYVKSVRLIRNETNVFALIYSGTERVSMVDVRSGTVVDVRWGNIICTSYNDFCIAMNNSILVKGSVPTQIINFGRYDILALGIDNNKIFLYTESDEYVQLMLPEMLTTRTFIERLPLTAKHVYTFKPEIIVYVSDVGYMGFLVNGGEWKMYDVWPAFHAIPSAVFVLGHLLVLGLNTGVVYVYRVDDFENWDFKCESRKRIVFELSPVIAIDIIIRDTEEHLLIAHRTKLYVTKCF